MTEELTITNKGWMKTAHRLVSDAARTATKLKHLLRRASNQVNQADYLDTIIKAQPGIQTQSQNEEQETLRKLAMDAIAIAYQRVTAYTQAKLVAAVEMEERADEFFKVKEPPFPKYNPASRPVETNGKEI